jgi:peroxiredoxin
VTQMARELNDARTYWRTERVSARRLAVMDRATEELVAKGIRKTALKVGDSVQDFILMDAHGNPVRLWDLLKDGPTVISFYRGGWCIYCDIELRGLQRIFPQIEELGASLIAISPQLPDNSMLTEERLQLKFPILSDVGNVVAKRLGVVFELPPSLVRLYREFGHELAQMNGPTGANELPVPATFVIDCKGITRLAFIDEDYTKRLDPERIIAILRRL